MKNKKIILIISTIIVIAIASYFIFFQKASETTPTANTGTLVGDKALTNDAQGFKYEDGSKVNIDKNASRVSASPSGDRFLAFIEPSSAYPVGKQLVYSLNGGSTTLAPDAEQARWLKDSTFVYTRNDGVNIKILTNNTTGENEIFSKKCLHISLVVANSSSVIANCQTPEDSHIAYSVNVDSKDASKLNLPEDNVVLSASPDLNYLIIADPNKTEDSYAILNQAQNSTQQLTTNFYPESVKWINSVSFLATADKNGNNGLDDLNTSTANVLLKLNISEDGSVASSELKTFDSKIIDYNIIGSKVIALLYNRSKIELGL